MQNFLSLISTLRFNSYFTFRVPETTPISDPNFPLILNQKHKEPFDIDGFTTGNKEIFAAVGIPHKTIEDVYLYYTENQPINHFFSASNLSLFVGPNKTYTFLKVLYNEFKCQDYAISYKKDGKQLSIPLWKFDEQYIYRINKTPILVSKFKNEDLFIEIITYAPVGEDDRSFPLLVRSVIVNNISSSKLENILFLSIFANKGQTWNITSKQKFEVVISEKSNKPNEANESSMPNMTYVCDTLFDGYSTIEDLDDFSSLELPFEDQNKIENFTINDSYGIILSTKFENLDPGTPGLAHFTLWANDNSENSGQLSGNLIHEIDFYRLLLETIKQEEMWNEAVTISTDDPKINDFIDTMVELMRIHEGYNAIHTGSTIYDHGYAFFRDNYWIQRAYFKAGRLNAPKKDFEFMINCVKENGLANSYKISTGEPQFSSMEVRVETPAFLPLMTQNYYLWTKDADLIFQIYPLLRNIMKEPLPAPNGLFILNSDETWIWPSYVNEIDYYIDNSYLMIAAAEFIENITYSIDFVEPSEKSNQFDRINLMKYNLNHESLKPRSQKIQNKGFLKEIMDFKENIIKAVVKNYLDHDKMEFAHSIDINSLKDTTSFIQSASTPFLIKNIFEALDEFKTHDILDTKSICKNTFHKSINSMGLYDEQTQPLIRSHSRTAATVGNVFGHSLFAATEMNLPNNIMAKLIDSSLKSLSCTGTSAEIFDIYYPRWCTEKRRLWDSLSIFEGFLHYLFEIEPGIEVCKFRPKILNDKGYTIIKDIQIHSNNYIALAYRARDLDKMIHDNPFIGDIKEGILWTINQMAYESIADDEQFDSPLNEEITDHELPPRYRSNDYLAATNMIVKEIYQKPNLPQTDYKFLVQTTMDSQILVFSNNNIGIPHNNEPQSEIFLYFIEPEPVSKEAMEYLSQLNIFKMKEQYTNNMFLNKYYANANKDINEEHVNFEQAQPSEAFNFDFIIDNIKSLQSFTDEELSFILNRDPEFLEKKHIIMRSGASILKNDIMSYKIDPAFLQDIENIFSKDMSAGELKIVNHNTESFQSSLSYEDYRELYHDNTGKNDNLENSEEKMQPAETEEDYSIEDSDKIKDFSLLLNISKCPILYVDMKLIRCSSSTNFNGISIDIVFFENTNEYELLILNKSSFPLIFYVNNEFIVIPDLGIYTQSGNVEYAENPEEKPKEGKRKSRENQILVPKDKNCELVKKQLLEKIIFDNNIPNAIILYDSASENHAKEIYRELILLKSIEFIRQTTDFEKPIDQMPFSPTTNLIIVTELKKNQLLDLERYEKILEEDNYSIWKHCVPPLRFLIIVHNHGHVYKDTIDLCNDLGTYLRPRRLRARSMFPYGFFTFLDEMGEPFGDSLTIKVFTSKPMSLYYNDKAITVDGDESKTEQGIELTDQLRKEMEMAFVMVGSFDYDITNPNLKLLNNRIIKLNVNSPLKIQNEKGLEKPYIVIKTIKPFAPFEASASGMSSGKNMMKVIIETDSEEQIDILIQILFDQQTHLAWLNGSQRERVKDPCQLVKLENGDKIFQAVLHPGRDIHPKALIHKNRPKYRTVHAVFGRYPRWN